MFTKRDVKLSQEYFAFLLLNLADLFLTGWIFRHEGQEANGVALWILTHFGLTGFAIYKFLMVMFLIVICEIIATVSPQRARFVIIGGCLVYLCVIIYESYLIIKFIDKPAETQSYRYHRIYIQTIVQRPQSAKSQLYKVLT